VQGTVQGMQVGTVSDSDLVAAVRAGDDAAFEELYRRYRRRIGAFVYRFVRDEGRAEDVTQEAFFSALRRIRQTDCPINFKPWIYEIARNAAIDLHRRTSRAEEVSISDGAMQSGDRSRLVALGAPDSALDAKQRLEHLRAALDELSETHNRILVLRELEGLSYREIGERMDLTAPAVESTLFRARRRLEQEYAELDTGRRCASMRAVIARLSEGIESARDRRRLERHARRCGLCRRRARELGVEPVAVPRAASRAAALVPIPAFLRRRHAGEALAGAANGGAAGGSAVSALTPAVGGGFITGKAAALVAAAALVGGGGATLGGVGPLAPDLGGGGAPKQTQQAPAAPSASPGKTLVPSGPAGPGSGATARGAGGQGGRGSEAAGGSSGSGGHGLPGGGLPGDLGLPGAPELPGVKAPDLPEAPAPQVPNVEVPDAKLPATPKLELPDVPQVPSPQLNLPPVEVPDTSGLLESAPSVPPLP
jgi:RNA polymerase sigma factor (sigma-70 family)